MKKIIIPLLILLVFFGPFLLNYNFEGTKEDGSKSYWSVWKLIRGDKNKELVTKNTKAETYYNECRTPYTDKQFIEYQFADIILRHPCSVNGGAARMYIGKTNTSITKNYNLRLIIQWSKESGLVWWNDGFLNENYNKYKEYEFDFYGRLFLKKQGHSNSMDKDIIYKNTLAPPPHANNKLPENAVLLDKNNEAGISIYETPWSMHIQNSKYKNIIIRLDGKKDRRNRDIFLYCGTVNINLNTLKRIQQNFKVIDVIRQTEYEPECSTGWYITESTYVRFVGMSLSKVDLFKQIYEEVNSQLESFVVTKNHTLPTKEK